MPSTRLAVFCLLLAMIGCSNPDGPEFVVVTTWNNPSNQPESASLQRLVEPRPVRWIHVRPHALSAWIRSGRPADLVLGGPWWLYAHLDHQEAFLPRAGLERGWDRTRARPVVLSQVPGTVVTPDRWNRPFDTETGIQLAWSDPRLDPAMRAWCQTLLDRGPWPDAYARLLRIAATANRSGPLPAFDSLTPADARLAAGDPPRPDASTPFHPIDPTVSLLEGGGVPRSATDPDLSQRALNLFLMNSTASSEPVNPWLDAARRDLTADLLGATLIDAQPELQAAWAAIESAGRPSQWQQRLLQPPPWPPASVLQLQVDPDGADTLDTLAASITPNPEARDWLLDAWNRPESRIDGSVLSELAAAADGSLARDDRFLAWIRAEWTAWARQWYRWIGRRSAFQPSETSTNSLDAVAEAQP